MWMVLFPNVVFNASREELPGMKKRQSFSGEIENFGEAGQRVGFEVEVEVEVEVEKVDVSISGDEARALHCHSR